MRTSTAMRGFSAFLYARSTSAPAILSATLSGWHGFTFSNMVLPLSRTEQALHKVILRALTPAYSAAAVFFHDGINFVPCKVRILLEQHGHLNERRLHHAACGGVLAKQAVGADGLLTLDVPRKCLCEGLDAPLVDEIFASALFQPAATSLCKFPLRQAAHRFSALRKDTRLASAYPRLPAQRPPADRPPPVRRDPVPAVRSAYTVPVDHPVFFRTGASVWVPSRAWGRPGLFRLSPKNLTLSVKNMLIG